MLRNPGDHGTGPEGEPTSRPGDRDAPTPGIACNCAATSAAAGELSGRLSERDLRVNTAITAVRVDPTTLDAKSSVDALEQLRVLQSWISHREHALIGRAYDTVTAEHRELIDQQDALDAAATDTGTDADSLADSSGATADAPGLSRAQQRGVAHRSALAEIATVLRISETTAETLHTRSRMLAGPVAATGEALADGTITAEAAKVITRSVREFLPENQPHGTVSPAWGVAVTHLETTLLPAAIRGAVSARLRAIAARAREVHHPHTFPVRATRAVANRYVRITPARDGMSYLTALLPTASAYAIDRRLKALTAEAKTTPAWHRDSAETEALLDENASGATETDTGNPGPSTTRPIDARTTTQTRADVLIDLLGGIDNPPGTLFTPTGLGLDAPCPAPARSNAHSAGVQPDGQSGRTLDGGTTRTRTDAPRDTDEPLRRGPEISAPPGRSPAVPDEPLAPSGWEPPPPEVLVTIPIDTLFGGPNPAHIDGLGPIAAQDARRIAATATSCGIALLTHTGNGLCAPGGPNESSGLPNRPPDTGKPPRHGDAPPGHQIPPDELTPDEDTNAEDEHADIVMALAKLEVALGSSLTNGKQYRIRAALRRRLQHRDQTCRFPGCARPARGCDVDHVQAFAHEGQTTAENLAHLCRQHHTLKHNSAWTVATDTTDGMGSGVDQGRPLPAKLQAAHNRLTWTSPTGRRYTTIAATQAPPF